jgi:hypothetical protein
VRDNETSLLPIAKSKTRNKHEKNTPKSVNMLTRAAWREKNISLPEGRTLALGGLKYALESWRQTLAIARFPKAKLFHCSA